jgi:hypothetical protein
MVEPLITNNAEGLLKEAYTPIPHKQLLQKRSSISVPEARRYVTGRLIGIRIADRNPDKIKVPPDNPSGGTFV